MMPSPPMMSTEVFFTGRRCCLFEVETGCPFLAVTGILFDLCHLLAILFLFPVLRASFILSALFFFLLLMKLLSPTYISLPALFFFWFLAHHYCIRPWHQGNPVLLHSTLERATMSWIEEHGGGRRSLSPAQKP
jgi:hypothetical protein